MNIRMTEESIRFRISSKELEVLNKKNALTETLEFPDTSCLHFDVAVKSEMSSALSFTRNGDRMVLEVSEGDFEKFKKTLPSKAGLVANIPRNHGPLQVSFEVDILR